MPQLRDNIHLEENKLYIHTYLFIKQTLYACMQINQVKRKLPSEEKIFFQDEGAHKGYNYQHQGAKSSCKDRAFFLYH